MGSPALGEPGRLAAVPLEWASPVQEAIFRRPTGIESVTFVGPLLSTPKWIEDARMLVKGLPAPIQEVIDRHERAGTTSSEEYVKATELFYNQITS